jgi:hypothetical protein
MVLLFYQWIIYIIHQKNLDFLMFCSYLATKTQISLKE